MNALDRLPRMRADWERFFALYGVEPLRISYEELVADAAGTVRRIASHARVAWDGDVGLDSAITTKLADERSERWAGLLRSRHQL